MKSTQNTSTAQFSLIVFCVALALFNTAATTCAATHNLIPRLPEFVLERGYSDAFQVVNCEAHTRVVEDTAESSVKVILKNISETRIQSSLKIRILYLTSDASVQLAVDGKPYKYDRNNPRISFSLDKDQEISISLNAKHNIQYSIEAMNRAPASQAIEEETTTKKRGFLLNDLTALFDNEKLVKRFMIGPLVSKWGIFPIDFKQVKITIVVPPEFDAVIPNQAAWKITSNRKEKVFVFEGTEDFSGALFLPKEDAELLRKQLNARKEQTASASLSTAP